MTVPLIRIELNAYSVDKDGFTTAPVVRVDLDPTKDAVGKFIETRPAESLRTLGFEFQQGTQAIFWHRDFDPKLANAPYTCMKGELDYRDGYGWFAKMRGQAQHLKTLNDYDQAND